MKCPNCGEGRKLVVDVVELRKIYFKHHCGKHYGIEEMRFSGMLEDIVKSITDIVGVEDE